VLVRADGCNGLVNRDTLDLILFTQCFTDHTRRRCRRHRSMQRLDLLVMRSLHKTFHDNVHSSSSVTIRRYRLTCAQKL